MAVLSQLWMSIRCALPWDESSSATWMVVWRLEPRSRSADAEEVHMVGELLPDGTRVGLQECKMRCVMHTRAPASQRRSIDRSRLRKLGVLLWQVHSRTSHCLRSRSQVVHPQELPSKKRNSQDRDDTPRTIGQSQRSPLERSEADGSPSNGMPRDFSDSTMGRTVPSDVWI